MILEITDHLTGDRQVYNVDSRVALWALATVAADRFGYRDGHRCRLGILGDDGRVQRIQELWAVGEVGEPRLALVVS